MLLCLKHYVAHFWGKHRALGVHNCSVYGAPLMHHEIQKALRMLQLENESLTHLPLLLRKQLHDNQVPIQGSITSNNPINKNVSITILGWRKK